MAAPVATCSETITYLNDRVCSRAMSNWFKRLMHPAEPREGEAESSEEIGNPEESYGGAAGYAGLAGAEGAETAEADLSEFEPPRHP
jgi:hypothetical protein